MMITYCNGEFVEGKCVKCGRISNSSKIHHLKPKYFESNFTSSIRNRIGLLRKEKHGQTVFCTEVKETENGHEFIAVEMEKGGIFDHYYLIKVEDITNIPNLVGEVNFELEKRLKNEKT